MLHPALAPPQICGLNPCPYLRVSSSLVASSLPLLPVLDSSCSFCRSAFNVDISCLCFSLHTAKGIGKERSMRSRSNMRRQGGLRSGHPLLCSYPVALFAPLQLSPHLSSLSSSFALRAPAASATLSCSASTCC